MPPSVKYGSPYRSLLVPGMFNYAPSLLVGTAYQTRKPLHQPHAGVEAHPRTDSGTICSANVETTGNPSSREEDLAGQACRCDGLGRVPSTRCTHEFCSSRTMTRVPFPGHNGRTR